MNRFQQWLIAVLTALVTSACASVPASSSPEPWFSQAEIDQMLAPVALYPDSVLSHVLIAATYPLEVVQAARWSRDNPGLNGELAVDAVENQDWDPSVKALVAFPELLKRMDDDIEWTQRLGDAFLVQEADVVAAIQHLRDQAYASGHLRSDEHVRVVRETEVIYIEPVQTRTVYVPYYDPRVVYGRWRWTSYPPVYWHHPPRYVSGVSFYWGPAYRIAPTFYFSSFHWSRKQVVVVNHHHYHGDRHFRSGREVASYRGARHWQHNPHHRRGVNYHRGVSENHFVEPSTAATRGQSSTPRIVRQRGQQREWAADQRRSLNLREQSASQTTPQRSSMTGTRQSQASSTTQAAASESRQAPRRALQSSQNSVSERSAATQATPNSRERVQRSQPQLRERLSSQRAPERSLGVRSTSSERAASPTSTPSRRAGIELPDSISGSRQAPRTRATTPTRGTPVPAASRPVTPSRSTPSSSSPVRSAPTQAAPVPSAPVRSAPSQSAPARTAPSSPASEPRRKSTPQRAAPAPRTRNTAPARSEGRVRSRTRDGGEQRRQR